ncbi:hypothetical protein KOI35_07425 [Actinoplanes bogorensis]|uniref:Calcium-binding protein n=1 Tax=Paractinoplanes bogorensis TaxID=1610840 RepID=A0ABS5YIW1_9ACTN|nr:calcium-binding protein [Actinoplanes bogorensis]MBU2663338.1 hypothetical protein [Actinoplanes bogorensis]
MSKRKTFVAGVLGVVGVAWTAVPAEAATSGTVSKVSGNVVVYTAAPGKANNVRLSRTGSTLTVDDIYGLKAGPGCAAVKGDVTRITCAGAVWIRADLGDGNDTLVNNSGLGMTAWGRGGNDKITGGPARDDVYGGDGNDAIWGLGGNDVLRGEAGNDALSGGDGNDTIADGTGNDRLLGGNGDDVFINQQGNDVFDGGAGNDSFNTPTDYPAGTDRDSFTGGPGTDVVDYQSRKKPVTADADGVAGDDGSAGEGDSISSTVEGLGGGDAADRLLGTTRDEGFFGGPGNDVIAGSTGDDLLWGEDGNDYLNGAGGYDACVDAAAGDTVLNCEESGSAVTTLTSARPTGATRMELLIKLRTSS